MRKTVVPKSTHAIRPGAYLTKEGKTVIITRIVEDRAYGRFPDSCDVTWWYVATGQHAVYLPDDLVSRVDVASSIHKTRPPKRPK